MWDKQITYSSCDILISRILGQSMMPSGEWTRTVIWMMELMMAPVVVDLRESSVSSWFYISLVQSTLYLKWSCFLSHVFPDLRVVHWFNGSWPFWRLNPFCKDSFSVFISTWGSLLSYWGLHKNRMRTLTLIASFTTCHGNRSNTRYLI